MAKRYEVVESRVWRHKESGRTASIYGALPWTSASEKGNWEMVTRGYTLRNNATNTVGVGRQPFATREEAEAWAEQLEQGRKERD